MLKMQDIERCAVYMILSNFLSTTIILYLSVLEASLST